MIIGIGVDILDVRRIEAVINRQEDRFINKIYTDNEKKYAFARSKPNETFAKIFAAKEAVIKAISNVKGVFWKDIEILHYENGKPYVRLSNKAHSNIKEHLYNIELSISDEYPYAIAFVIIEKVFKSY